MTNKSPWRYQYHLRQPDWLNHRAKDGLFVEDKESPYVNLIVARETNKDAENVKKFVQAYQSDEVYDAANKAFNGGAVKGW